MLMFLQVSNFEIVLALLTKIVAFYMQITIINVGVLELKRLVKVVSSHVILGLLNLDLYKLSKELVDES